MKLKNQTNHGQNIPTSEHVKTLQCNVFTTMRYTITTTRKDAQPKLNVASHHNVSTITLMTILILLLTTCKELGKSKPETNTAAKEQLTLSYVVTFAIGKATADGKPSEVGRCTNRRAKANNTRDITTRYSGKGNAVGCETPNEERNGYSVLCAKEKWNFGISFFCEEGKCALFDSEAE
jgi:hypothetical protein